ncbi:chemotaxis protein CheA [Acidisoma sp.]|uniref:chemotaxis protein CheA n=1 Tax=Acidisoma sp. TaxID=1872115 RepID=UPI003AFFBFF6
MNALLEQFLVEARELMDTAVPALLQMERGEGGTAVVNTVFRAVHTLKGTSGLFDFAPLTSMVHAGEDLLDALRAGRLTVTSRMVDLLLAMIDQVRSWIDTLERTEELPAGAATIAAEHALSLGAVMNGVRPEGPAGDKSDCEGPVAAPDWVAELPENERIAAEQRARNARRDLVAINYRPDKGCFFSGEDPLQLLRQVPELAVLRMVEPVPWPPADRLDPLECLLAFRMISTAPVADLRHLFRYSDTTEITSYSPPPAPPADWPVVASVLAAQTRLLGRQCAVELAAGRAASVGEILRRVARHCSDAPPAEDALASAVALAGDGDPATLLGLVQMQAEACTRAAAQPVSALPLPRADENVEPATLDGLAEARRRGEPTTLRVDQAQIDTLMNLIGELIVAKNSLSYLARKAEAGASAREMAHDIKDQQAVVNRLAGDMQSVIMAIRMLPVSQVFQRFPRLVRDISRKLDKQVELEYSGEETEADKNMIEVLADPLMHMVRNSLDHGIEPRSERIAAGKPACGTIRLAAEQANESIIVTIRDDGRGIDPARVRLKAVERGMLDTATAAALTDREALRLVFAPGFSTAEAVSDLSGRGVGMDVVRSAVERVGGRVDLESQLGEGTTVRMTLPMTMAVTRIMTIECAGHLFGIPMNALVESVRLPASAVHRIRGSEAFVLRQRVLPLLRLARLLELPVDDGEDTGAEISVLVLRVGSTTVGLVIDAFRERMEAIVRPLEGALAGLPSFVGTTLLGDGRVLMILNVAELSL